MKFRRHPSDQAVPDWKREALATFSDWLAALPDDTPPPEGEAPPTEPAVGLVDLADAVTALGRETKALARTSDRSHRDLEQFLATAREQSGPDSAGLEAQRRAQATERGRRERDDLLCDVADACESLAVARGQLAEADAAPRSPGWLRGRRRRDAQPAAAPAVDIPLRKLRDILGRNGVEAVAHPGQAFDAATMRAAGLSHGSGVAPGAVSEVIRQGYRIQGRANQPAEVMVEQEEDKET